MSDNKKDAKKEIVNKESSKANKTSLNKEGRGKSNKANKNLFSVRSIHKNGKKFEIKEEQKEDKFEVITEKGNNKLNQKINKEEPKLNVVIKENKSKEEKDKNIKIEIISKSETKQNINNNINNNSNNNKEKIIQKSTNNTNTKNIPINNNNNNKNKKEDNIIKNNNENNKKDNIIQNNNKNNKSESIVQNNNNHNKVENIISNNNNNSNNKLEKIVENNNNNNNKSENIAQNINNNNKACNLIQNNSNNNYIEKATINNNFIINKDNPLMINANLANPNIINNNIKNSTINNNYIIRNNNITNKNNNVNINNINFDLNNLGNNFINDFPFKENIINRNDIERNNYADNMRFMRGQSVQPKSSRNSFLNRKHHLLENAIIKNQYEEPKSKVVLKNEKYPSCIYNSNIDPYNSSKNIQKIISLDESDSENFFFSNSKQYGNDMSQDFDEEDYDDEEYHLNNNENKNSKRSKGKNSINSNLNSKKKSPEELLFDELNSLIRKYTFIKIVQCVVKYYKNELTINQDKDEDNEIIKRLKSLLSRYDKNSVHMPLMNILENITKESRDIITNLVNMPDKRFTPIEIKENQKERSQRRGNSQKLLLNKDIIKEKRKHTKKPSPPFYYGKHFFKVDGKIYTYVPKAKTASMNRYTLYCMYRAKEECMAKIIVHQNDNKVSYIGNHVCNPKLSLEEFYKKYPYIKKEPDWSHIQFAVENEKPFILSKI